MTTPSPDDRELLACPFCAKPLYVKRGKINPSARCMTEDCYGQKMSVVNLDDPRDVAAWNTRSAALPEQAENPSREEWLVIAADIIDAAFISPPKGYKVKCENRELMIEILAGTMLARLAAKPADDGVREAMKCPHGNTNWRWCHLCNPD